MGNLTKDFFIGLSNNKLLNAGAKKWGFRLGAEKFVAGTTLDELVRTVKELNQHGIEATIDNLGEFISDRQEANAAKNEIIQILDTIAEEQLDCHATVKLTQLGLDIDRDFCLENMQEILDVAAGYGIFVNIDMEKYEHYRETLNMLFTLRKDYTNVGTVIQAYLLEAEEDLDSLQDIRIRLVKGAYKENEDVAYQTKEDIDRNFIRMAKRRLKGHTFTSIATHDHHIIQELKDFIADNHISHDMFEFQMLYGFRTDMHYRLAEEGFQFCTYIPFGRDWFGYFMRRLAERPQNMNLVLKDVFYTEDNKLKKEPLIAGAAAASLMAICIGKRYRKAG